MSQEQEREEAEDAPASEEDIERGDGSAGPAEDIENDPAYEPDDENLKGIKGG